MKLLFHKKIIGCNSVVIRGLIADMMQCIESWNNIDDDEIYEFRLVLHELISNGVVHGNKRMCDKALIAIIYEIDSYTISICIQDEGEGFEHTSINKRSLSSLDPIMLSESGRGLKLVKAMCDDIQINYKGNQIKVDKSIKKKHIL